MTNDDARAARGFSRRWGDGGAARLPYSERKRWLAAAPGGRRAAPRPRCRSLGAQGTARAAGSAVRLSPNGAHSVALVAPKDAEIRAAGSGAFVRPIDAGQQDGRYMMRCFGRSCDGLVMDAGHRHRRGRSSSSCSAGGRDCRPRRRRCCAPARPTPARNSTILAMVAFFAIMHGISKHYDKVTNELLVEEDDQVLPTRVHAMVLVSKVHKPTMRALAYAKAARPNVSRRSWWTRTPP